VLVAIVKALFRLAKDGGDSLQQHCVQS